MPGRKALWCFHSPLFRLSITRSMTVFRWLPASLGWVPMVEGEELFVMKQQSFTALTCLVAPSRTKAKGLSMSHNSALSHGREIVTQRTFSKKNSTVDLDRQEKELEDRLIEVVQSESRKKKE